MNRNIERYDVYYAGRVQGVGFRYTVRRIADGIDVAGFVRNLPDGRVQLVAEGDPVELDRLVDGINDAMRSNIDEAEVRRGNASGEFSGFAIRH